MSDTEMTGPVAWQRRNLHGIWVNCPDGWDERDCKDWPDEYRPLYLAFALENVQSSCREQIRSVWANCEAIEDDASDALSRDDLHEYAKAFYRGQKMAAKSIRRATGLPGAVADDVKAYTIGDLTMEHVFRAANMTNMSDMQAVMDAVERALASLSTPAHVVDATRKGR